MPTEPEGDQSERDTRARGKKNEAVTEEKGEFEKRRRAKDDHRTGS